MFTLLHSGSSQEAYFLFHGTGGNNFQLLRVMEELNPNATIIGVNATEGRGTQRRYFPQLINGKLERTSFTSKVNNFIKEWNIQKFEFKKIVFLGYSNGANFILGLLEQLPQIASHVILLHPSNLNYHFKITSDTNIILTSGATDTISLPGDIVILKEQLLQHYRNTKYILVDSGHELSDDEIQTIKKLIFQK